MTKRIALIMSGGHLMGIAAHAGALAAILRAGYDVVGMSALSAGSIVALGYANGLSTPDALDMVPRTLLWRSGEHKPGKVTTTPRTPLVSTRTPQQWAGRYPRVYDTEGKGADLDTTLQRVINLPLGKTRRDCRVRVWTANAERPGAPATVWDTHDEANADLPSWRVARASMAIPLVFAPAELRGEWHWDGGVAVGNLPPLDDWSDENCPRCAAWYSPILYDNGGDRTFEGLQCNCTPDDLTQVVALYSGHSHPAERDGNRGRFHGVRETAERLVSVVGGAMLQRNLQDNPDVPIVHLPIVGDAGNFGASLEELEATRLDGQRAVEDAIREGVL